MATSNSVDFVVTRNDIINDAYSHIGHLTEGEILGSDRLSYAARQLNKMLKAWAKAGFHLWTYKEATLFLTASTSSYSIPGSRCVSSYVETTTSAAAVATDNTVDLTSVTGVSDTNVIGIVTSDSAIHWTTVSGAPAGSTVTLANALTSDAASGSTVYVYATTSLIARPLNIDSVRRYREAVETPCIKMSRQEYFDLPQKSNSGTPVQFYYDPSLTTGVLYVWNSPSSVNDLLKITHTQHIEDFDLSTDDTALPSEWSEAISWNLAVRLGFRENADAQTMSMVKGMADQMYEDMMGYDQEDAPVIFQPGRY